MNWLARLFKRDEPLVLKVQTLVLEPDDIIVLTTDEKNIDDDTLKRMRRAIEERFPGHGAMVLQRGMELSVVRYAKPGPPPMFQTMIQDGLASTAGLPRRN